MNTLDELKYYCNEDNFVGALMLSGEWGSGKTYLVDNILKSELSETHVIIRISLFGFDTIEEVHTDIKKSWVRAYSELKEPVHGISNNVIKIKDKLKPVIELLKNVFQDYTKFDISRYLSINLLDFVNV